MEQRGFVYRVVNSDDIGRFMEHLSTNMPILPFASNIYTAICIYHMEQTRDQFTTEWTIERHALVSQPR